MKIIDPHLHLFNLVEGNYHWLKAENPPFWPDKATLNRSFFEEELVLSTPLTLAGYVHIEAGFDNDNPIREIQWLEQHCKKPFRTIACADLTSGNFELLIQQLLQYSSVIGIRHILDEAAFAILSHPNTLKNLAYLAHQQLIFEAQLSLVDDASCQLLDKLLTQTNVKITINHAGFPEFDKISQWLSNLKLLSQHKSLAFKCSGWEMLNRHYDANWLSTCLSHLLATVDNKRIMLASNFPVSTLSLSYAALWQLYLTQLNLSAEQFQQLSFENAKQWYGFD